MDIEKTIVQVYPIKCRGRNIFEKPILETPIEVTVRIVKKFGSEIISGYVRCPYSTGGKNPLCNPNNSSWEKDENLAKCFYRFDIPSFKK
jgi:hypothetical protein